LNEFNGDAKKAFVNLDENPIWQNKEKGIAIKRVSISGVSNAQALHTKKDHFGNEVLDDNGNQIPVDFVSPGNNHHIAIYRDEEGNLQEEIVTFYDAVIRKNLGLSIINKNHEKGWEFLFSMKKNEFFIIPNEAFNTDDIDLSNPKNYNLISPYLFRVQSISSKYYIFNHHLETRNADGNLFKNYKNLSGITYNFFRTTNKLKNISKVRINHLGQIVQQGEY
jgi:CRISPR-associated endonuclease Csn1